MSVQGAAPPVERLAEGPITVGHFVLSAQVAAGRRTIAFLARDRSQETIVLRQLREGWDAEVFEAELKSARGMAAGEPAQPITHEGGRVYVPVKAVVGESLATILEQAFAEARPIEIGVALTIAIGIAERLTAMGDKRAHGDLVPHHVLVGYDGSIHLLDPAGDAHRERAQAPSRARYRSPEHVKVEPLTSASDIYSLGILLFEMSTATPLFKGETARDNDAEILESPTPRPRDIVGDGYPIELQLVLRKLLRPTIAGRFADGKAAREALRLVAAPRADAGSASLGTWMKVRFATRYEKWRTLAGLPERSDSESTRDPTLPIPKARPLSREVTHLSSPGVPDPPSLAARGRFEALEQSSGPFTIDPTLKAEIDALKNRKRAPPPAAAAAAAPADPPSNEEPYEDPEPTELAGGGGLTLEALEAADAQGVSLFHSGELGPATPSTTAAPAPVAKPKKPVSRPLAPPLSAPLPDLPTELGQRPLPTAIKDLAPLITEDMGKKARGDATDLEEIVGPDGRPLTGGPLEPPALFDMSGLPPLSDAINDVPGHEDTPADLDLEITRQESSTRSPLPPRDSTLVDPLPPMKRVGAARATFKNAPALSDDLVLEQTETGDGPRSSTPEDLNGDTIDDGGVLEQLSREDLAKMAEAIDLPIPPPPPKAPPKPVGLPPPTPARPPTPLFKEPAPLLSPEERSTAEQGRIATQIVRDRVVPNEASPSQVMRSPPASAVQRNVATQIVRDRVVPNDGAVPDAEEWSEPAPPTRRVGERVPASRAATAPMPRSSSEEQLLGDESGTSLVIPISDDELERSSKTRLIVIAISVVALLIVGGGLFILSRTADTEVEAIEVDGQPRPSARAAPPPAPPPVEVAPTPAREAPPTPEPPAGDAPAPDATKDNEPAPEPPSSPPTKAAPPPAPPPLEPIDEEAVEPEPTAPEPRAPTKRPARPSKAARPAKAATPPPTATEPAPEPPAPAAPARVTIRVLPESAVVKVDGNEIKNGSAIEVGDSAVNIEASAPGYEPARATVEPGWSKPVLMMLRKSKVEGEPPG